MAIIGQLTLNEVQILEVDADPTAGGGIAAPIGSTATLGNSTTAQLWIKTGTPDTDWVLMVDNYVSILNSIAFG